MTGDWDFSGIVIPSAALLIFMRRTFPVEPSEPIEPAEPLSNKIKGQLAR